MNAYLKSAFLALALAPCIGGCGNGRSLRIKPSDVAGVKYVKYTDPSGFFTMNIPRGWRVKTGLKPDGKLDLISYAITVYDPSHPERELYYNLNNALGVKSQAAHDWYVKSYGANSYFAKMPVLRQMSTAGFFDAMGPYYGFRQFNVLERIGRTQLGGDLVVAECTSTRNGKKLQGLYHAVVQGMTYMVQRNPFNFNSGQVDVGVVTEFTIISETAAKEDFVDWQPVLDHCLSTIVFSQSFHKQRRQAWAQLMGNAAYIAQTGNQISDMIMDSYKRRNATYDVLSQKRSDATLGYERVQDTETGEYYRAENGFTDWYDGKRYRPATENAAYTSPISGYINWK